METGEVWLPNGREVLYSAAEGTAPNLRHKDLATGVERRLLSSPRFQFPTAVSPDGTQVFYQQRTELGTWDVLSVALDDPQRVTPVFATGFSEHSFRMSPDGTRAAFVSDESGRPQTYVAAWPITGEKIMVSTGGGVRPRWGRSGRELYFLSAGRLMMVPIDAEGNPGAARALFDARGWLDFDVARDGRFIANVAKVLSRELPLSVIVNWSGYAALTRPPDATLGRLPRHGGHQRAADDHGPRLRVERHHVQQLGERRHGVHEHLEADGHAAPAIAKGFENMWRGASTAPARRALPRCPTCASASVMNATVVARSGAVCERPEKRGQRRRP